MDLNNSIGVKEASFLTSILSQDCYDSKQETDQNLICSKSAIYINYSIHEFK